MIAKATAISHGINALRYITGESAHKKQPEKIHHIATYFFDGAFTARSMLEAIKFKCADYPRLKNNMIRIEISPAEEYTRDFTDDDWRQLWEEFAAAFDNQEITDERTGKIVSPRTHITNSKATVWLHRDSTSGIPHLHAAVCRVDELGNLNNDHQIHLRAQRAAERIAKRRGWATANDKRFDHIRQASQDCTDALTAMYSWKWEWYVARLRDKGYDVRERRDSNGVLHGYTLRKGNVIIKASELRGRAFTVSRLEDTWQKLHAQKKTDTQAQKMQRALTAASTDAARTSRTQDEQTRQTPMPTTSRVVATPKQQPAPAPKLNYATLVDYTQYRTGTTSYMLEHDGKEQRIYLPEKVMELFDNEFDYRETANCEELTNLAVALFIGMAGGPASASSGGGGGSSTDNNLGRDKDEDDLHWARRCAKAATQKLGRQAKHGYRR